MYTQLPTHGREHPVRLHECRRSQHSPDRPCLQTWSSIVQLVVLGLVNTQVCQGLSRSCKRYKVYNTTPKRYTARTSLQYSRTRFTSKYLHSRHTYTSLASRCMAQRCLSGQKSHLSLYVRQYIQAYRQQIDRCRSQNSNG